MRSGEGGWRGFKIIATIAGRRGTLNRKHRLWLVLFGCLVFVLALMLALEAPIWAAPSQSPERQTVPTLDPWIYLPIVVRNSRTPTQEALSYPDRCYDVAASGSRPDTFLISQTTLCRFGFGSTRRPIDQYDSDELARLRAGLYMNWGTSAAQPQPNGIEYVQTVHVKQWKWKDGQRVYADFEAPYEIPYTYTISPRGGTLETIAQARPGSLWLIGNEIERRDWQTSSGGTSHQDEILPEMYAQAYHEAYTTIKGADPTAQVAIGGVIQATPLRLEYLNRIWDEYYRLYGQPIPVDWWNVHAFVLQEKRGDWGADIPAGIAVTEGILYTMNDNKDWSKAAELIRAFRQWMKERGQQNKPLIVSEYSVNMPWFSAEVVRDEFMYPSFEFFLNEKDLNLGYPADEYRLVQRWIWYSLDDDSGNFNGFLFYSGHFENPMGLAPLGQYWETYVSNPISVPVYVDLAPVRVSYAPPSLFSSNGESVTATIYAQISNSGNVVVSDPFAVELWDEDSHQILGSKAISGLAGCGETSAISVVWTSMSAGAHNVSVRVDTGSAITESNEVNNQMPAMILVATQQAFLPLVLRALP